MQHENDKSVLTDIFFDIYRFAEISGEIYRLDHFNDKNKLSFNKDYAYIHIIQKATCLFKIDHVETDLILKDGDILVLPVLCAHSIELVGNRDADAYVMSCVFQLSGIYGEAIAEGLPTYIHVPSHNDAEKVAEWVPMTVAAIKLELEHPMLGSRIMLSRIIDLLLVWSIRFWLAKQSIEHKSWIFALRDPAMSKVLSQIHEHPAHDWDVVKLAKIANQSKSNFSKKFVDLVGVSPIQYLKNWRMKLASELVKETDKSIFHIAESVGYSSQAAFTRAFTQTFGCAPKIFREVSIQTDRTFEVDL